MTTENTQNLTTGEHTTASGDNLPSDHTLLKVEVTLETQTPTEPKVKEKVVIGAFNEELPHHQRNRRRPWWGDEAFKPHHFQQRIQALKPQKAKVLITPQAYKEMLLYVEIGQKEVGWLGTVTRQEDGNFLIDKTFLLEQEVTSAETELSAEDIGKMTEALLDQGDEGFDQANRLRFWGHSHVRMGTSPSGTDENTMRHRQEEGFEWYIRGIFNKLGRAEFTIYDFELGYAVCDAPWMVIDPETGRNLTPRGGGFPGFPAHRVVEEEAFLGIQHPLGVTGRNHRQHAIAGHHATPDAQTQAIHYSGLPPELVPDEELREQIKAEFAAKVTERSYGARMGKWWQENQGNLVAVDVQTDFSQAGLALAQNGQLPPSEIGLDAAWPLHAGTGSPLSEFPQSPWPENQGSFRHTNPPQETATGYEPPERKRFRSHYIEPQPHWLVRVFNFILGKS